MAPPGWPGPCCGARCLAAPGSLLGPLLDGPSRHASAAPSSGARLSHGIVCLAAVGQARTATRSSFSTVSPSLTRTSITVASAFSFTLVSIFMASVTARASPFSSK